MEIELGLKVSRPSHEAISTNLRISKDGSNPLFLSIETKTMFILLANLRGYPREKLMIDINGDGTEIAISGEKGTDEVVVRGFRKVFRIPSGVVVDGINATFNEKESVLKILMPKSVKGISGVGIEEVKKEETDGGRHEMANPEESEAAEVGADQAKTHQGAEIEEDRVQQENGGDETHHRSQQQDDRTESRNPDHPEEVEGMREDIPAQDDRVELPQETVVDDDDERKGSLAPSRKSKLCSPCFLAGSAILVSIVAILFHFIRPRRR